MSVESSSSVNASASRSLYREEGKDVLRNLPLSAASPTFELPALSPRYRQGGTGGDAREALDEAGQRQERDGISDLRRDAPPLHAGERHIRQIELGRVNTKPQAKAAEPLAQDAPKAWEAEVSVPPVKSPEKLAEAPVDTAGKLTEKPLQLSGDKRLARKNEVVGTTLAKQEVPMPSSVLEPPPLISVPQPGLRGNAQLAQGAISADVRALRQPEREASSQDQRQQGEAQHRREETHLRSEALPQAREAGAERVAAFQVTQQESALPSQNAAHSELISGILQQIERLREQGRTAMQVNMPLPDGQEVRLVLRMSGERVQVKLHAPDRELEDALREDWADLSERAARSGIDLDTPLFFDNATESAAEHGETLSQLA